MYGTANGAYDFTEGGYYYTRKSTTEVEMAQPPAAYKIKNVTIPSTVVHNDSTFRVVGIGKFAFYSDKVLESVTMHDGIRYVGDCAFRECWNLTSVNFSENVASLGRQSFFQCKSLADITLPAALAKIGPEAFYLCEKLAAFRLSAGNTAFSLNNNGILYSGDGKTLCLVPPAYTADVKIPEGVERIDTNAFFGNKLITSVSFPSTLRVICKEAFFECKIKNPVFNQGLEAIEESAFYRIEMGDTISLPSSLNRLGAQVFDGVYTPKCIEVWNPVPPKIQSNTFEFAWQFRVAFRVPEGSLEAYKADPMWAKYTISDNLTGGVGGMEADDPVVTQIYSETGMRLSRMGRGINILRMSDGTTRKVFVP